MILFSVEEGAGETSADQLVAVKSNAVLDQLVVDLEHEKGGSLHYKANAACLVVSEGRESIEFVIPKAEHLVTDDKAASLAWDVPTIKFTGSGFNIEVGALSIAAESVINKDSL